MLHPTSSELNGSRPRRVPPAASPSRAPWRTALAMLALGTLAGCGSSGGGGTETEPDNAALAARAVAPRFHRETALRRAPPKSCQSCAAPRR